MRRLCQHVVALLCICVGLVAPVAFASKTDAAFSITPTGRLHWDASRHDSKFRRLWLGAQGAPAMRLRPRTPSHLSRAIRPTVATFSDGLDTAVDKWSLEYARVHGSWSWQGEFSGGLLDDGSEHARLLAGYSALSWFVSGHARRYDVASGSFMRVQGVFPNSPGWELALRYERMHGRQRDKNGLDRIDLSVSVLTLASNWYLRPNLRLMLNLVMNHERDHLTRSSGHSRELIARAQYDF